MFMNECRLNHTHMKFEFKILLSSLPMFVWNNRVNRTYFPSFAEIINQRQRNCTERRKCYNRFIKK